MCAGNVVQILITVRAALRLLSVSEAHDLYLVGLLSLWRWGIHVVELSSFSLLPFCPLVSQLFVGLL